MLPRSSWCLAVLAWIAFAAGGISSGCRRSGDGQGGGTCAAAAKKGIPPCRWYPLDPVETKRWIRQSSGDWGRMRGRHLGICGTNDFFTTKQDRNRLPLISQITWDVNKLGYECETFGTKQSVCHTKKFCTWNEATGDCLADGRVQDMYYRSCEGSSARRLFTCMAAYRKRDSCNNDTSCVWHPGFDVCLYKGLQGVIDRGQEALNAWWTANVNNLQPKAYFTFRGNCKIVKMTYRSEVYKEQCYGVNFHQNQTAKAMRRTCLERVCNWDWNPGATDLEPPYWSCNPNLAIVRGLMYGPEDNSRVKAQAIQCFDPAMTERGQRACTNYRLY